MSDQDRPPAQGSPPSEVAGTDRWLNAEKETITVGKTKVSIRAVSIGKSTLRTRTKGTQVEAGENRLIVRVNVINQDVNNAINYESWQPGPRAPANGKPAVSLKDDRGNTYKLMNDDTPEMATERLGSRRIPPGESVLDVILFETPADGFEKLYLELSIHNLNPSVKEDKTIRFMIPRSMVNK
jgi:hypothetical protein